MPENETENVRKDADGLIQLEEETNTNWVLVKYIYIYICTIYSQSEYQDGVYFFPLKFVFPSFPRSKSLEV